MLKRRGRVQFLCLLLSLLLIFEPLALAAADKPDRGPKEGEFSAGEALSPGEYLQKIKEIRGENRAEMEEISWANWATMMSNVFLLMDANAIDVPSFQNALGQTLDTTTSVKDFAAALPDRIESIGKILTWGSVHFGKAIKTGLNKAKLANFATTMMKHWGSVSTKFGPKLEKICDFCDFMHAPGNAGEAEAYGQWLRRKPPTTEGVKALSRAQGAAMTVGIVINLVQAGVEFKAFADAWKSDAGSISYATVEHAIEGTVLLACVAMALIPPPPGWAVAIAIVTAVWETLKKVFETIGDKIQQWHKAYEDSLTFLKETDRDFSAFLSANKDDTVFGCSQEKSSALNLADKLQKAAKENPAEGEIGERQKEMVQNLRNQGLLTTWYYQQATASKTLPSDLSQVEDLWNHRADYMTWKPKKIDWGWNPLSDLAQIGEYTFDSIGQEVTGSEDQMNEDKKNHPHMVHFCPDFALVVFYRNFITHKRSNGMTRLPPLLSFVGVRVEQAPFNYIPLLEVYKNNNNNWTDALLGEAVAADAFNVGTKELPFLKEQVNAAKDTFEDAVKSAIGKMLAMNPDSAVEMNYDALKYSLVKYVGSVASHRAQLEGLIDAFDKNRDENIKDKRIEYEFDGDEKDFKLVDTLFSPDLGFLSQPSMHGYSGMSSDPIRNFAVGVLRGKDKPENDDRTAAKIFENFKVPLARSLEFSLNSLGITGVDFVNLMAQVKAARDILALARWTLEQRRDAFDKIGSLFTSEAFKRLITKGEYLDVSRDGWNKFFSGYDPPKDVLKKEIENFEDAINDVEKKINKRQEDIEKMQKLVADEYQKLFSVLKKYEASAGETGMDLEIRSSDAGYSPDVLKPITDMTGLNPEAGN